MTEDDQFIPYNGDSHDSNKVASVFNSKDMKQDGLIREVRGGIANERDGLEEIGQQPLEKSSTTKPDISQRDPKLVYLYCLPFFAEGTNQPHR